MKTTTILLAAILITSCTEENRKLEPPAPQTPAEQAETFEVFFKKFAADAEFQKSRIKFPLTSEVYDIDSEKPVTSTIEANKWEFFNLNQPMLNKKYVLTTRKKKGQYIVNIIMADTGVYVDYIFERQNGKWTLVKIVDQST